MNLSSHKISFLITHCLLSVGRLPGGLDIIVALGFREEEGGSLVLPLDANVKEIQARKLEIETGLGILRNKIASGAFASGDTTGDKGKDPKDAKEDAKGGDKRGKSNVKSAKSSANEPKAKAVAAGAGATADAGDENVSPAMLQKKDHALQEEKNKRLKAETALFQQKAIVADLQAQLSEMQEIEQRNLSLRQGLTINRLTSDERDAIKKEAHSQGKDSFAFSPRPDATGPSKEPSVPPPKSTSKSSDAEAKAKASVVPDAAAARTTLTKAAAPGDTKLLIQSNDGFKKGMRVLVGTGTKVEMAIVTGIGSLLLDRPLVSNHPVGAPIVGYASNAKSLHVMDRRLSTEFVTGILLEEIIPTAASIGDRKFLERELNEIYARRLMLQHNYTLSVKTPFSIGRGDRSSVDATPAASFVASVDGKLESIELAFGVVELINLFEDLASLRSAAPSEEEILGGSIDASSLLDRINGEKPLCGAFQLISETQRAVSIKALIDRFVDQDERLSWSAFCSMVRPAANKTLRFMPLDNMPRGCELDQNSLDLLSRAFHLLDANGDDTIGGSEALALFAELDGAVTDLEAFNLAASRVLGRQSDLKLTDMNFIRIREEYCKIIRTMPGGLCLQGRLRMRAVIESMLEAGATASSISSQTNWGSLLSPSEVMTRLPHSMLDSYVLSAGTQLSVVLSRLPPAFPATDFLEEVIGRSRVGGAVQKRKLWIDAQSLEMCQVVVDPSGRITYALSRDGVAHVFETFSGRKLFEQRLIWSEPVPIRAVEGSEKFMSWRKDNFLDSTSNSADATLKAEDTLKLSVLLSEFTLSLPEEIGSNRIISVDSDSGVVVVNCSVTSGAICIHDSTSLRRIYRIKAPGKLCTELYDAVQNILCGRIQRHRPTIRQCAGAVSAIKVWTQKSLLLCTIVGGDSLHVISLLTGDTVAELNGHIGPLTSLAMYPLTDQIFTGSEDKTVRIWKALDCIPHRLALIGGFDDPAMNRLEKRVTKASVGPGSRQLLRSLILRLNSSLGLRPHWRRGRIVSFFDGKKCSGVPPPETHAVGIEVAFADASVQTFSNRNSLRDPREILRAPFGPPFWSEPEATRVLGQEVAVFDIDPAFAAATCARLLGVECHIQMSFEECQRCFERVLNGRDEPVDVAAAFLAAGLEREDLMSLYSLIRRLYGLQEREARKCDRLLAGHGSAVTAIAILNCSKLIVTIDRNGCCYLWDPVGSTAFLSLHDPLDRPASIGCAPYAMVCRTNVLSPKVMGDTVNESHAISLHVVQVPEELSVPFPIDNKTFMKALSMDSKYKASDVSVRGFIYVMKDLSFLSVETACFLPALVAMDNPLNFLYSPRLSSEGSMESGTGLSKLQRIYYLRQSILRIIYAVSCSHTTIDELASDLNQYGVVQRGYTTTPSERIEVLCFERPAGWLEHSKSFKGTKRYCANASLKHSGTIVSSIKSRHGTQFSIAMDFSNDIVTVDASRVSKLLHRYTRPQLLQSYEGSSSAATADITLGSHVEFSMERPQSNVLGRNSTPEASEVVLVQASISRGPGQMDNMLIPIVIGRSSFAVKAKDMEVPVLEDVKAKLTKAFESEVEIAVGRMASNKFLHAILRSSWMPSFELLNKRVFDILSSPNLDLNEANYFEMMTAMSNVSYSVLSSAINQFICFAIQNVSQSHPFMTFLNSLIGGHGPAVFQSFSKLVDSNSATDAGKAWLEQLDGVQSKQLMRLGVTLDEVYTGSGGLRYRNFETCLARINAFIAHNHDPLGPVDAGVISTLFKRASHDLSLAASAAPEDRALVALAKDRAKIGIVKTLVLQHYLVRALTYHSVALRGVTDDGMQTLQAYLSIIVQPALLAVKDASTLLPLPSRIECSREYPAKLELPGGGQYGLFSKNPYDLFFPGIKFDIVKGTRTRSADTNVYTFMRWRYKGRDEDVSSTLMAAMGRLSQVLTPVQREAPVVRLIDGISFTAETGVGGLTTEWSDNWCSLSSITRQHGGLLQKGKVELFRIISTRLIDAVMDLHDRNIGLRSLSPATIIMNETGTRLNLLVLPTFCELDGFEMDLNQSSNGVLSAYIAECVDRPTLLACVPNFGMDWSANDISWDVWSFGMCLFILAFGTEPLSAKSLAFISNMRTDQGKSEHVASPAPTMETTAGSILYRLMQPMLSAKRPTGNTAEDTALAIAQSLQTILDERSRGLIFSLVQELTGQSLDRLYKFRTAFCAEAPVCGLTEWTAGILFERLVQNLFGRLRGGSTALTAMRNRLAVTPQDLNPETAKAFASELGLILTKSEFDALVISLSTDISKRPYCEKAAKAFKSISLMLDEIQGYGLFQQVLYIISRCLSPDPAQRPSLHELRQLPFFGLVDESSIAKASSEARLLLTPYQTAHDFFEIALISPMRTCLANIFPFPGTSVQVSVHSDLELLSTTMGRVEETVSMLSSKLLGREAAASDETNPFLLSSRVDLTWLYDNIADVVSLIAAGQLMPAIALYTMRFLVSDASQSIDDGDALQAGSTVNLKGMSLGSRLLMRVAKFFQHMVATLTSMSKHLNVVSIATGSSEDVGASKLKARTVAESLYRSVVSSVVMLYLGEESTLPLHGLFATKLERSHKVLFSPKALSVNGAVIPPLTAQFAESRWSVQYCKLFEPILIDLVGEDGRGSARMPLGGDCLRRADFLAPLVLSMTNKKNMKVASAASLASFTEPNDFFTVNFDTGMECRGTVYFVSLVRLVRSFCSVEGTSGRALERAQANVGSSVLNLLPSLPMSVTKLSLEESLRRLSSSTAAMHCDSSALQRIQVVLDTRCPARLQSYFSCTEDSVKNFLAKICCRALSVCVSVSAEQSLQEPYLSLGAEFSSPGWVQGLTDILRGKVVNVETSLFAAQSFRLMAMRRHWMRSWTTFDVLSVLSYITRAGNSQAADIRGEAKVALKLSAINRPEAARAMVDLRILSSEIIPGVSGIGSLTPILIEANDMSFGSTLNEQANFTSQLEEWISFHFPSELPTPNTLKSFNKHIDLNRDAVWVGLFEIATHISASIPRMCMTLAIQDSLGAAAKKEKAALSCDVAARQLAILERILLYALAQRHPQAMSAVISCIWAPPDRAAAAETVDQSGTGVMSCLDHLTSTGTYMDPFQSFHLQYQIMQMLVRTFEAADKMLLNALCSCGIVRVFGNYLQGAFTFIKDVSRLGLLGPFGREFRSFVACMRSTWRALIDSRDNVVYEEVIEAGIMVKMVEEWLPCAVSLPVATTDAEYNPLVSRVEAAGMLRAMALQRPGTERLVSEAVRCFIAAGTCRKEVASLRSSSTKKGSSAARKMAAEVLVTIAMLGAEALDRELMVRCAF